MVLDKCLNEHTFYYLLHGNLNAYLHLLSNLKLNRCLEALLRIKMACINPQIKTFYAITNFLFSSIANSKYQCCFISGLPKAKSEGH